MCALSAGSILLRSYTVLSDTPWKQGQPLCHGTGQRLCRARPFCPLSRARPTDPSPEGRVGGKKCKSTQHVRRFPVGAGFFLALSVISLSSEAQYPITPVLACITGRSSRDHESNQLRTRHLVRNSPRVGAAQPGDPRQQRPSERHGRRRRSKTAKGFAGADPRHGRGVSAGPALGRSRGRDGDAAPPSPASSPRAGPAAGRLPPSSGAAAG